MFSNTPLFRPRSFHPTDTRLIDGNGPFNPGAAYDKPEEKID
jgi:hypothetical protein